MGNALYVDWIYNLHPDIFSHAITTNMTQEERNKWFEQNVYYRLKASSEYVWLYNENMDWWKNENIPNGIVDAIKKAKEKLVKGQKLGYDMAPIFNETEGYKIPGNGDHSWW
jgi:hypothetical protein